MSAKNWARRRIFVKLKILFWQNFVNFLQENLNSKYLRMLNLSNRLKKVRQLLNQIVVELITYVNDLKVQLSKSLTNYQQYCNFMKSLHSHLRIEIIRRTNIVISRIELKKLTRLIEKTEFVSKNLKTKIRSSRIESKSRRYRSYFKLEDFALSSDSVSQDAVQSLNRVEEREREDWRERDDRDRNESRSKSIRTHYRDDRSFENENFSYDKSNVKCYNCEQKDYYKNECTQSKKSKFYENDFVKSRWWPSLNESRPPFLHRHVPLERDHIVLIFLFSLFYPLNVHELWLIFFSLYR
jgi:hypothetical protein